jgi:hypothetical protein
LELLLPADNAEIGTQAPLDFTWLETTQAAVYRIDIYAGDRVVLSGLVPAGIAVYRARPWVRQRVAAGPLRWRVGSGHSGQAIGVSAWRNLKPRRHSGFHFAQQTQPFSLFWLPHTRAEDSAAADS